MSGLRAGGFAIRCAHFLQGNVPILFLSSCTCTFPMILLFFFFGLARTQRKEQALPELVKLGPAESGALYVPEISPCPDQLFGSPRCPLGAQGSADDLAPKKTFSTDDLCEFIIHRPPVLVLAHRSRPNSMQLLNPVSGRPKKNGFGLNLYSIHVSSKHLTYGCSGAKNGTNETLPRPWPHPHGFCRDEKLNKRGFLDKQ